MAGNIGAESRTISHGNYSIQRWNIQDLQLLYCSLTVTALILEVYSSTHMLWFR